MERTGIIPLFPLDKVLFPQQVLPLHIFEERYKEMVGQALEAEAGFGILQTGSELPHRVGTYARPIKVIQSYDDGRMDILCQGERRYVVDEFLDDRSYLRGRVEFFSDSSGPFAARSAVEEMLRLYRAFIARLGLEIDQKQALEDMVTEMKQEQEMSYIIGQTIGMDLPSQQELLEATVPAQRVELLRQRLRLQEAVHRRARNLFEQDEFDPSVN